MQFLGMCSKTRFYPGKIVPQEQIRQAASMVSHYEVSPFDPPVEYIKELCRFYAGTTRHQHSSVNIQKWVNNPPNGTGVVLAITHDKEKNSVYLCQKNGNETTLVRLEVEALPQVAQKFICI